MITPNAVENGKKLGHSFFFFFSGGMENDTATMENSWQFPIKLNIQFPYDLAIILLGIYHREMKTYIHTIYTGMFIVQNWKQSTCLSIAEWLNKLRYIHTTEYYSAIKRNELLIHATTWIKYQGIILSEKSYSPTVICYIISFILYFWNKIIEIEKRLVIAWSQGLGVWREVVVAIKGQHKGSLCWWNTLSLDYINVNILVVMILMARAWQGRKANLYLD